ncbi:hypothetical protein [Streptomyces sp. 8K308]|uniref:hypothetical protein n=1 Tax=Streptomyces sp. 8K308 TaxID=2530388 RepID=UPI003262F5CF
MSCGLKASPQPSPYSRTRVHEVARRTECRQERRPGGGPARPGQAEGQIVVDLGADVLDHQRADEARVAGGELVGVDATERMPEHHGLPDPQVPQDARRVLDVGGAGEVGREVGVAVPTLVEGDDPPVPAETPGQRRPSPK